MAATERFAAMGTRIELHLFGAGDAEALAAARRAIVAVDDALTIHRPSAATRLNAALMAGRAASIDDPILLEAMILIDEARTVTFGLFDPAAHAGRPGARWEALGFDRARGHVAPALPVALDFGGFGKGFALDHAAAALRSAGVASAFLCAGESSIAVVGEHPLGGGWPVAVPDPAGEDRTLVELELLDEALSISSTIGPGTHAPDRAAMIRPSDGTTVAAPRTTIAVERSGALAEMMSTALLVAGEDRAGRLREGGPGCRFRFELQPIGMQ